MTPEERWRQVNDLEQELIDLFPWGKPRQVGIVVDLLDLEKLRNLYEKTYSLTPA